MRGKSSENLLKAISLNYLEAPVEIREKLTFDEGQTKALLIHLKDVIGIEEALVLSTCNRTEIYFNHSASVKKVFKVVAAFRGLESSKIESYFQFFSESELSIRHLFRVAIGLESQILGDLQIINQVKNAYQWCADLDMAGTFLHRLLHTIFFVNKRVVQETDLRSGSASISYATSELVTDLLADKNQSITLFGVGEMGLPILKNLIDNGFQNISVCNRSEEKVKPFVEENGVQYIPFENWEDGLSSSLIISALSGSVLKISEEIIENHKPFGFQYFIDLGVPRSVNPELENKEGIVLFNIDQIQSKVSDAVLQRRNSIPTVEFILNQAIDEFLVWAKEMQVSPIIHLMKNSLEQIRKEEMARFLKKAGGKEAEWADELTKNLMQRIMKTHIVQLKAACKRDDAEKLTEVLEQLFNPAAHEVNES